MRLAQVPQAPSGRSSLREEVLAVLAVSLLASVAYAVLSLFEAPIRGATVASANQSPLFGRQLLGFIFGLAPAFLVFHLVRRTGEGPAGIGLSFDSPRWDLLSGFGLFAVVGLAGIGVYLGSVALGLNRFVVPVPPTGHWWTVPALLMNALEAAVVEETIVVGYLITRLQQTGWSPLAAVGASALLRGGYHLYQGWGGFGGNLAMGLLFGTLFVWKRRTWPFIVAHLLLDVGAGVGWLLFRDRLPS